MGTTFKHTQFSDEQHEELNLSEDSDSHDDNDNKSTEPKRHKLRSYDCKKPIAKLAISPKQAAPAATTNNWGKCIMNLVMPTTAQAPPLTNNPCT